MIRKYNPLLNGHPGAWDRERKPAGGGGGGGDQAYYTEANRLYGIQADTAEFMLGLSKDRLPGAIDRYEQAALQYSDPAFEAQMVGKANVDAQNAFSAQKSAMTRDMARYGLNPASGRWGSMMNQGAIQGAAMQAGAANNARQFVQDKRFGAAKDYYSSLAGVPSDAASAAGNAASGFAQMANNKSAAAQNEAAGWGTAIGLGMGMYSGWKDGGEIRLAGGGVARGRGILPTFDAQGMPPQPTPQVQDQSAGMAQAFKAGKGLMDAYSGSKAGALSSKVGGAASQLGGLTGDVGLASWGTGAQAAAGGADLAGAIGAYNEAATAASLAGDAALAAEMTTAAQGLSAGASAAGSSAALGAASAAMPWVAAAAALGSMFGLFSAGGEAPDVEPDVLEAAKANIYESLFSEPYTGSEEQIVKVQQLVQSLMAQEGGEGREDMTAGGEVDGPGTETSDSIPARLSDGEFVVNAEAMKDPQDAALVRQINEKGLQRRYGGEVRAADGGPISYVWDKLTGKQKDPKVESEERKAATRKLAGQGMVGQAGDKMRNSMSRAEEEANRQIRGYRKGGLVKKGC